MITKCRDCGEYVVEGNDPVCRHPNRTDAIMCGNSCDRPATVITKPTGYTFCEACYLGFKLGQRCPQETVKVIDD